MFPKVFSLLYGKLVQILEIIKMYQMWKLEKEILFKHILANLGKNISSIVVQSRKE